VMKKLRGGERSSTTRFSYHGGAKMRAGRAMATTGGGVAPFYRGEGVGRRSVKERSRWPAMGFNAAIMELKRRGKGSRQGIDSVGGRLHSLLSF
jgi:hypothetical protein